MLPLYLMLKAAFRAIGRNKMRSGLTVLGIIIGVGAVIAMVGIGEGASNLVKSQISSLGDNLINIFPGSFSSGGRHDVAGSSSSLTEADAAAIEKQVPYVSAVSPIARSGAMLVYENQNWSTGIMGGNSNYFTIRTWPIVDGAGFNESAVRSAAKVCVIGGTVSKQLFQGQEPVGQTIRIGKLPFTVVGVLASKGQNSWGQDQDDIVIAPYTTVMKRISGSNYLNMILASANSFEAVPAATDAITQLLRMRHKIGAGKDDDFTVRTQQDLASVMGSTSQVMRGLLAAIASVSLLVGGIGIMNIMLVSVTERTREIGIRMAVGAKGWHVLVQFLSEAVVLASCGGLIGIGLGVASAHLVQRFAHWPVLVPPEAVGISFLFSAAIGIFFGFWPARKASRLDPIEALRYE